MVVHLTPCVDCCNEVPPCCNFAASPATATLTLTIDGLAPITEPMTRFLGVNSGYFNTNFATPYCDLGDGRTISLSVDIECTNQDPNIWNLVILYAVSTNGVLGNYVQWDYQFITDTTPDEVTLSCSPFHLHFDGTNTSGVDGDGATLLCGGRNYPFNATPGTINAVLDIVTP